MSLEKSTPIAEGLRIDGAAESPLLDDFLRAAPETRGHWLSLRPFSAALALIDIYVEDERFRLTDVFACEDANWRQHMIDRVAGNSAKGISQSTKQFLLAPAYEGDTVFVEMGTKGGRRQHARIDAPIRVPPQQACSVMSQYGPSVAVDCNKNRIIELASVEVYKPKPIPPDVLEIFYPEKAPKKDSKKR